MGLWTDEALGNSKVKLNIIGHARGNEIFIIGGGEVVAMLF